MDYQVLRKRNIHKSLLTINDIIQTDIDEYNECNGENLIITKDNLKELNEMMKIIFNYITYVPNVYVMTDKIEKYFDNGGNLVSNIQSNILCKLNPQTTEKTSFELFDEIFHEIVYPSILEIVFNILSEPINIVLIKIVNVMELIGNNNYFLNSMLLDAVNSPSHNNN